METDYSSDSSDSEFLPHGLLEMQGCLVCGSESGLKRCGGCRVVSYCGTAHQTAHRSQHKAHCNAIKKSRETLEREEAALRAQPGDILTPADVFESCVGRFWGIWGTRDYMRARFAHTTALIDANTLLAVESALEHLQDMLRLCRSDNLGVRDIIPNLLLRLGREQECYDFIKWWTIIDDKDHYNGRYDWGDVSLPYLDIHGADAFEPVDAFCTGNASLAQLVALTLLKLRLHLDLEAYPESYGYGFNDPDPGFDRPLGKLVRKKMRTLDGTDASVMAEKLQEQYRKLCQVVNDANPHFWDALVESEGQPPPPPPPYYSPGTLEEVDLVLHQCLSAWEETDDAIVMIGADTWKFTRVYEGADPDARAGNAQANNGVSGTGKLEMRRGTGKVFPSTIKLLSPTISPAELFPPTAAAHGQTVRFVCRNDQTRVLVYVDGACPNNGQPEPRAGWAVVCGTPGSGERPLSCVVSGRLENKGPFGDEYVATSNRAELRGAIAALRLCDWTGDGYTSIVIATDSSYVVDGATGWAKGWVRNGWKTRTGDDVKNKDLWDLLLGEVERWKDQGLRVEFWKIPRELNTDADAAAKQAANNGAPVGDFKDIMLSLKTTGATGRPRILTLCLEEERMFDACFGTLVSKLTSKADMERATTPKAALAKLTGDSPPSVILVVDGALTRQRKVWECVIDRLRAGATVVLAGCFSGMVNEGEFCRFFAKLGLPWKRGSYHRSTTTLRRGAVGDDRLASRLPSAYSQKALFAQGIQRSMAWYTERESSTEAAVVFTPVGAGKLGYIGDVNGEESSDTVVMAMCGLLG